MNTVHVVYINTFSKKNKKIPAFIGEVHPTQKYRLIIIVAIFIVIITITIITIIIIDTVIVESIKQGDSILYL